MTDQQETILPARNPDMPTTDPPDVKEAKVWSATAQNLGAIAGICFLSWSQHWPIEYSLGAIAAVLGIVQLPAVFGKKPGSLGVFSLVGKPLAATLAVLLKSSSAIVLVLPLAVVAALLCSSCTPSAYEPDWTAVHRTADAMRSDVAGVVSKLHEAKGARDAVCKLIPDTAECRSLAQLYDVTQQALATFGNAVNVYESAGVGAERVESAIRELHMRVDDFVVSAQKTVATLDGVDPGVVKP